MRIARNTQFLATIFLGLLCLPLRSAEAEFLVGVAKVDITPAYPIRLAGYAARKSESEGVAQRVFAKALAFGEKGTSAILITVDSCGVPWSVRQEVVSRLRKAGLKAERVTVCSTHTHSAPLVRGYLPNLFYPPMSMAEQNRVGQYAAELEDALEQVALSAMRARRPAKLSYGEGTAAFAANRRTKGGPVDNDVPVLVAEGEDGQPFAILTSYACHCTTLTGSFNEICGDWAGFGAESLEAQYPGATVLVAIGCGGDANPAERPGLEVARRHGNALAGAVRTVVERPRKPVRLPLKCRSTEIYLRYDRLPTLAEWEAKAGQTNHIGEQARWNVERLRRGEKLPDRLPYLVQTWVFGKDLAMVFLPGEVVVDYSLRLKRELDAERLWVNAYANDVPCYIPSERVLKEGGYEGEGAMVYYDRPARFAPGIEDHIIKTVEKQLPGSWKHASSP